MPRVPEIGTVVLEKNIFKVRQCIFAIFAIFLLHLKKLESLLPKGAFVKYGFDLVVLEKKILNAVKCSFTIMPLYLLNNMSGLSFENKI